MPNLVTTSRSFLEWAQSLPNVVIPAGLESDMQDAIEEAEAAEQSVQPTLLTRCPKCNAVTGWHHPLCEDYSPESQSG